MTTYAIFYDGQLDEVFESTEEEAKTKFTTVLGVEDGEGSLFDSIELFELKKIEEYKFVSLEDNEVENGKKG